MIPWWACEYSWHSENALLSGSGLGQDQVVGAAGAAPEEEVADMSNRRDTCEDEFVSGAYELYGRDNLVLLTRDRGFYHVRRHPDHKRGWGIRSTQKLSEARELAEFMAREDV